MQQRSPEAEHDPGREPEIVLPVVEAGIIAVSLHPKPSSCFAPVPWSVQPSATFTALSFLNTNKYPPSLLFLLMTLGHALLFLRALDSGTPRILQPALIIGQVPMFYYLLPMPIIHSLAVVACFSRYGAVHSMFESPNIGQFPFTPRLGWGFFFAHGLPDMGADRSRPLSVLSLVCSL